MNSYEHAQKPNGFININPSFLIKGIPRGSGIPLQDGNRIRMVYGDEIEYCTDFIPSEIAVEQIPQKEWDRLKDALLVQNEGTPSEDYKITGLVDWLIKQCRSGVSDLFIEREGKELKLRARETDGSIKLITDYQISPSDLVWIKTQSGINKKKEAPIEEGSLNLKVMAKTYRFRISSILSKGGESTVIRPIENRGANSLNPGLPKTFEHMKFNNSGLHLIAGSTGSGKSTTLHYLITEKLTRNHKIITIEDPVEFVCPHTTQSNLDEVNNWGFEEALKHYLRADPDVLIIGELRDSKTAILAVRAALTGHAVYGTIHSPNAKSVWARLSNFGISESLIHETLKWVLHQNLIAKICRSCNGKNNRCLNCGGNGIQGRKAHFEFTDFTH